MWYRGRDVSARKKLRRLEERTAHLPSRIVSGGGGGGLQVDVVESLPEITHTGLRIVYWTSAGAGDGDDQCWMAFEGQEEWSPMQLLTDLSGEPG